MSYAIAITDVAEQDLHRLIDSLPASRRRDALEAVDEASVVITHFFRVPL